MTALRDLFRAMGAHPDLATRRQRAAGGLLMAAFLAACAVDWPALLWGAL